MGAMDLQHIQYMELRKGLQVLGTCEGLTENRAQEKGARSASASGVPSSDLRRRPLQKLVLQRYTGLERLLRGAGKAMNIRGELTEMETQGPAYSLQTSRENSDYEHKPGNGIGATG